MPAKRKSQAQKRTKTEKSKKEKTPRNAGAKAKKKAAPTESKASKDVFPIVGIGASAGGLEALELFFENLPVESGIAFVVITHTDPKRSSLLPSIIKRKTNAAVKQNKKIRIRFCWPSRM